MWYANCLLWGGIWFVLGVIFPPFWLFTALSLVVMLLPVGVSDKAEPKTVPNPEQWRKHG